MSSRRVERAMVFVLSLRHTRTDLDFLSSYFFIYRFFTCF